MALKVGPRASSFKFTIYMTLLAVITIVYYDVKREGGWQNSKTNKFFRDVGVCEYSHKLLDKTKEGLLYVEQQIEQQFPTYPVYREEVIKYTEPYIELIHNLGRIIYNVCGNIKEAVLEKYPIFIKSVEAYAPGVLQQSQNAISGVWSTSVLYFNRSVDYLRTEVFVGQLSPENMQKVVVEAFNVTQNKATEYYYWLYEKVQSTIK